MKIAIPVETRVREMDAKLYLSLLLVGDGHDVYLGESSSLNMGLDVIDPDIYISNCNFVDRKLANEIRAKVMLLDSEGGIIRNLDEYRERISSDRLRGIDAYLAWGEETADAVSENADTTDIVITGNPRFDLVQPTMRHLYKDRARDIIETYGEYLLINTNFPIANHRISDNPPENSLDRHYNVYEYNKGMYLRMLELIDELAKYFSDLCLIVRPHPSENFESYCDRFEQYSNVETIHEGDVREWICGAAAVIHNSCTTGIEAALLNTPVIAYDPVSPAEGIRSELPNKMSIVKEDIQAVIDEVESVVNSEPDYSLSSEQKSQLRRYIDNLEYSSAEKICSIINSTEPDTQSTTSYTPPLEERLKRLAITVSSDRTIDLLKQTGLRERWTISTQKFSYMSDSAFEDLIEQHQALIDVPSVRFQRENRFENVFLITQ